MIPDTRSTKIDVKIGIGIFDANQTIFVDIWSGEGGRGRWVRRPGGHDPT